MAKNDNTRTLEDSIIDYVQALKDGCAWHDRRNRRISGRLRYLWLVLYRPRWLALKL